MKFNVRIVSYGIACLLIVYLGHVFIGMRESLPPTLLDLGQPDAHVHVVKRDHLAPFDDRAQKQRIDTAAAYRSDIDSILDTLIEKGIRQTNYLF